MTMSRRALCITLAAALAVTTMAATHGWQGRSDHLAAAAALRDTRIALQRAQTARSLLRRAAGRLASLDLAREAFELDLVESIGTLAQSPGVSQLRYRRYGEPPVHGPGGEGIDDDIVPLRVALSFRSDHGVAFLRSMQALRALTSQRPLQVSGCRLQRAQRSLAISCALDWLWWDAA